MYIIKAEKVAVMSNFSKHSVPMKMESQEKIP